MKKKTRSTGSTHLTAAIALAAAAAQQAKALFHKAREKALELKAQAKAARKNARALKKEARKAKENLEALQKQLRKSLTKAKKRAVPARPARKPAAQVTTAKTPSETIEQPTAENP